MTSSQDREGGQGGSSPSNVDTNSSAENLLAESTDGESCDDGLSERIGANGYLNPACTDSIPSSPPPSYQHVLEETRLAALSSDERSQQQQQSRRNQDSQATSPSSSEESNHHTSASSSSDRCSTILDHPLMDQMQGSSASWIDHQEPSTSYLAGSPKTFDQSSLATLAIADSDDDDDDIDGIAEVDDDEDTGRYDCRLQSPQRTDEDSARYDCRLRPPQRKQEDIIEVVANKTSKEMYAAMARELGIQCRMSDQCRCLDCQGGYLECGSFDAADENGKTDGGLGAGTPMFVSEVFGHGTAPACVIL